eukprot:Hpha_TRINITY_DN15900_c0_g2::TRINITY_DN15900_c0_g2_i1::g.73696::m.73696
MVMVEENDARMAAREEVRRLKAELAECVLSARGIEGERRAAEEDFRKADRRAAVAESSAAFAPHQPPPIDPLIDAPPLRSASAQNMGHLVLPDAVRRGHLRFNCELRHLEELRRQVESEGAALMAEEEAARVAKLGREVELFELRQRRPREADTRVCRQALHQLQAEAAEARRQRHDARGRLEAAERALMAGHDSGRSRKQQSVPSGKVSAVVCADVPLAAGDKACASE